MVSTCGHLEHVNETYIEPVHVLVPIGARDGLVGDVWLLRVVFRIAVWLRGAGHWGGLRNELGVYGEIARDSLVGGHRGVAMRADVEGEKRRLARKRVAA